MVVHEASGAALPLRGCPRSDGHADDRRATRRPSKKSRAAAPKTTTNAGSYAVHRWPNAAATSRCWRPTTATAATHRWPTAATSASRRWCATAAAATYRWRPTAAATSRRWRPTAAARYTSPHGTAASRATSASDCWSAASTTRA